MRRRPQAWWLLPGLLLLLLAGFGLRLPGLFANTFHPDEALFASWARLIAVWRDPLLQTQAVDKPPLLFYLQALFYPLLATPAGFPARLPNFIASLLLLPLTGRAAWQLYRDPLAAVAAVALVAFSPLAIQFSSSAFTDPLLTTWLLAAVVASSAPGPYRRRAWWSGLFWGLALATKYQALLFLPLLLGLAWLARWPGRAWGWWLAGFAPAGALLLLWDGLRPGGFSLWHNQFSSYGGLRLAWSWELWPRLAAWANLSRYQLAIPWPLLLLLLGLGLLVLRRQPAAGAAYDALLFLFLAGYGLLHWLLAVPVWDRYWLPLVPLLALLAARLVARLLAGLWAYARPGRSPRRRYALLAGLALLLLAQIPAALAASRGAYPVGARPGADGGAAAVAAYLQAAPYGTVLYDHWFSWQWRYYFFDRGVYVSWFPHPAGLGDDLAVFAAGEGARYLVLPDSAVARPVLRAVTAAGFAPELVYPAGGMNLYRLQLAPAPAGWLVEGRR